MSKNIVRFLIVTNLLVIGILPIPLAKANPYLEHEVVPPPADVKPPTIVIASPEENAFYSNGSIIILDFNVTGPESPSILTGQITRVRYKGDWMPDAEYAYDQDRLSPEFLHFLNFTLNITGIPEGRHNIVITAFGSGGYAEGLTWYSFDLNSSSSVNFTIGKEPSPTTAIVTLATITTVIGIGIGVSMLSYFKKRRHKIQAIPYVRALYKGGYRQKSHNSTAFA